MYCLDLFKEDIKDFEKRVVAHGKNKIRTSTSTVSALSNKKFQTKYKNYKRAADIILGNPLKGDEEYRKLNQAIKNMIVLFEKDADTRNL